MIEALQKFLNEQTDLRLAFVYGSAARGNMTPKSDLDLAVAFGFSLSPDQRIDLSQKIGKILGLEVDLVDLREAHGVILEQILSTGRMVFKNDRLLHASLIKRMWLEKSDFYPLRERILARRRKKTLGTSI